MRNQTDRRTFLKRTTYAGIGAALLPMVTFSCSSKGQFDIIIRSAEIIDGLGGPPYTGDIGISGGMITAVGALEHASAGHEIIARGMAAAPGFIDIHSHTDSGLLRNPSADSKILQGVTLDVGGNCGGSPFPRRKDGSGIIQSPKDCTNFTYFAGQLEKSGFAPNTALLVGQGTVRSLVLGNEARKPSHSELELMQDLVRAAMEQGAAGMSSGLEYRPSGYADREEVTALCRVVAEYGGVYATHMRSEDEELVEAVEEALQTARESGVSLQISHLKAAGRPNWHKAETVIGLIDKARSEGLDVHCDRYPYLAYEKRDHDQGRCERRLGNDHDLECKTGGQHRIPGQADGRNCRHKKPGSVRPCMRPSYRRGWQRQHSRFRHER